MTASSRKKRILAALAAAAVAFAALWWALERNMTQVVLSLAQARAQSLAVLSLNAAVEEALQSGVSYEQLITVTRDESGSVRLLEANTAALNSLASRITLIAQRRLSELEDQTVSVPLGSALGLSIFAGAGPPIRVRILPVGTVSAAFDTEFVSAGINQTRHRLILSLTARVQLVIPSGARTVEAFSQLAVAESIIVGEVPQSFVDVNNDTDMLNLIP